MHCRAGFSDRQGTFRGGHISFGTEVYAMEVTVHQHQGEPLMFRGQTDAADAVDGKVDE